MKNIQITKLISLVLKELKRIGLKKTSVDYYETEVFKPILQFFVSRYESYFSYETISDYLAIIQQRHQKNEIGQKHFRALERGIRLLLEFYQNNKIEWGLKKRGWQIYLSELYENLVITYQNTLYLQSSTVQGRGAVIRQYLSYLESQGKYNTADIDLGDIKSFLACRMQSYRSISNLASTIRAFHKYLLDNKLCAVPFEKAFVTVSTGRKKIKPCLSQDEISRLLTTIDRSICQGKRDYAILSLAANTGLRSVDIANLKLTDIDWYNNEIKVVQKKTRHSLILSLQKDTSEAIADYILNGRPVSDSEFIFLRLNAPYREFNDGHAIGLIFKRRLKAAGIIREVGDGKSVHALRRSMGTRLAENLVPVTTISQILGHKKLDSGKQYISLDRISLKKCALGLTGININRKGLK